MTKVQMYHIYGEPSGLVLAPTSVNTESLALNASQDFALVATNRNIANCISTDTVRVNIAKSDSRCGK